MVIFTLSLIFIYFLTHLFLRFGLQKSLSLPVVNPSPKNKVTIIVAAKNEEKIIAQCISSLKKLTYNKENLEFFLVNDKSTDATKEIMLRETAGLKYFKVIDSRPESSTNLKGKANALDTAIHLSTGEIIIGTDADCKVNKDWVQEVVKYYDDQTAMVCGVTFINSSKSLFHKVQALDWIYLQTLASASSGINMTLSCIGNNLSFRKKIYEELGGYSNIKFSVTEDLALMQEMHAKGYNIKYPINENSLVETQACKDLDELFKQKRRWFRGGLKINILGLLLGAEMYPVNLILIFGWIFLNWEIYFLFLLIKIVSEIILMSKPISVYKFTSLYKFFLQFQFFFAFYGLTLPWTFLFNTKIHWKDRKF
ncbi:MAG: glycosyltransferase [Ignavibacteria bacterium]|nr:glycosyltransferase [Ignavibacteria bacterium]